MADKKISQLTAAATPLVGTEVFPIVQSGATVKSTIADVQAAPIAAQTASSMLYLNASKVPSTTANATFDGTNLGLGASPTFYGGRLAVGGHIAISGGNSLKLWNTGGTGLASLTSTGTNGLTIAASGNTTLSDGSLVVGTAGKGIDFSANTNAPGMTSELLTWYEEGNWKPIDASGGGLTLTVTSARYVRIGKVVHIYFYLTYPSTSDASNATIGGLPFTSGASIYSPSVASTNQGTQMGLRIAAAATTISVMNLATNTDYSNANLSGKFLIGMMTYFV